jgi:amino-acid N-acetyltransferase
VLRKAEESDVPGLFALIQGFASRGLLLRRTEASLRSGLSDFTVAEAEGEIVGCGALMPLGGGGLGEIRSLAVRDDWSGRGIGRRIVSSLIAEAPGRGFDSLLALTKRVSFFEALGFTLTRRELFLDKIMIDCAECPLNLCCEEQALTLSVSATTAVSEGAHQ